MNSHFSNQKTKKAPKVEVGTGVSEANMDEWLEVMKSLNFLLFGNFFILQNLILLSGDFQGTAYAQSVSSSKKEQKKKK